MDEGKSEENPKNLVELIIQKHQRFLDEYERELSTLNVLTVLEEKRDQLSHWVDSENPPGGIKNELEKTDKLIEEAKKKITIKNPKKRITILDEKIQLHKEGLTFWKEHNGRKGTQKADK